MVDTKFYDKNKIKPTQNPGVCGRGAPPNYMSDYKNYYFVLWSFDFSYKNLIPPSLHNGFNVEVH